MGRPLITQMQRDKAIGMLKAGYPQSEISKAVGLSRGSVSQIRKENGFPERATGHYTDMSEEWIQEWDAITERIRGYRRDRFSNAQ